MSALRKAFERIEEAILMLLLAAMTLITLWQVILRYIFNSGLLWALEATTYLFGWLVLIGISYGIRTHAHIGIDLLARSVGPAARRALGLTVILLGVLYAGIMLYGAYKYEVRMAKLGVEAQDIPLQRWVLGLCLPIGFGLLIVRLLEQGWLIATGRAKAILVADEAAEAIRQLGGGDETQGGAARRGE
jgi:C4-dicarboxylate transporter DctQ subunit